MLFNSLPFLIFFPFVLLIYFILPARWRWLFMLAASYFFYGYWKVEYLSLIIASTAIDFLMARVIAGAKNINTKKTALIISLTVNLGLLFFFKYFGWFIEGVVQPAGLLGDSAVNYYQLHLKFILPVGISFYTFQTMGYTIDVYFNQAKVERNPLKFGLFVSYFPQLVAGPIERFSHLHPQLFNAERFNYANLRSGLQLMLIGFFVKMCVADNVSNLVDSIFQNVETASSSQLIWGMLLFGIQIFCDFHGYSLIAIGAAKSMGVSLMDNFKSPYSSVSIREFWSRWHISLSTWFRDYLYIPLGGNRHGQMRWLMAVIIVFILSGLWHGANWTFVIWGAIHGMGYIIEKYFIRENSESLLESWFRWAITMVLVFLAWVFFRSDDLEAAFTYFERMISNQSGSLQLEIQWIILSFAGLFLAFDFGLRSIGYNQWIDAQKWHVRWSIYAFLIYGVLAYSGTVNHPFIYFQF